MFKPTAHVDFSGGLGNQLFALANLVAADTPYCVCRKATPSKNPHSTRDYTSTLFRKFPCQCSSESVHTVSIEHRYHAGIPSVVSLLAMDTNIEPKDAAFLHIRGGDYLGHPIHHVPMDGYYERAIRHFPADTLFYVFTNDRSYAESFEFLKSIRHEFVECDEVTGLAWMGQCKRGGICANSTYSWWGAVLDIQRTLVIPSRWSHDPVWNAKSDYTFPGALVEEVPLDLYCIHLAHRSDRMSHIESLRKRHPSLRIHVVDAIADSDGHRGCILSHKKVIEMAVQKRLPYVIVLEDDCEFLLPQQPLISSFLTTLEYMMTHPEIELVNGCGNLPILTATPVDSLKEVQFLKAPDVRTTHCVIYSASSYAKFLAFNETTPIDIQTNTLSMLFTYPYFATQLPSYSDIMKENVDYENIEKSRAFVQDILEGGLPKKTLYKFVNPLSILRIPIWANRM